MSVSQHSWLACLVALVVIVSAPGLAYAAEAVGDLPPELTSQQDPAAAADKYALGMLLLLGDARLPRDPKRAASLLYDAAEMGFAPAQSMTAMLMFEMKPEPERDAYAAELAQKAADQGEVAACPLLARAYAEGRGVVRNDIQAQTWRLLSRSQRYIEGPTFDALDARLTPTARREARKRADAWLKSHRP